MTLPPTIDPARAVWLLTTFCGLHQKSVDAVALARECVPSVSVEHFVRIAARLGLTVTVSEAELLSTQTSYPLIVRIATCVSLEGRALPSRSPSGCS